MRHYSNHDLAGLVSVEETVNALAPAFRALAEGTAQVQLRMATVSGALRLNTMAAIVPESGYCAVKVYTAIGTRYSFVILLFSAKDGRVLATFDAGELTKLRTAAVTCLAAKFMARPASSSLTVFGTGTQAAGHAAALVQVLPIDRIQIVSRDDASTFVERTAAATGAAVTQATAEDGVRAADVIVTATRSARPLFPGRWVKDGCFIAAVGSVLPNNAELDAETISRCGRIVVEAIDHAQHEAGDLIHAHRAGAFEWEKATTLGEIVLGNARGRASDAEITLFKSVGCALEDVVIAALAYEKLQSRSPD